MMDMIDAMEDDDTVKVLVIVSKPPAKEVRDKISARLSNFSKPVVTLFVGEKPEYHEENFYHATHWMRRSSCCRSCKRNKGSGSYC